MKTFVRSLIDITLQNAEKNGYKATSSLVCEITNQIYEIEDRDELMAMRAEFREALKNALETRELNDRIYRCYRIHAGLE